MYPAPTGVPAVATRSELPTSANTGDLCWCTDRGELWIFDERLVMGLGVVYPAWLHATPKHHECPNCPHQYIEVERR